ncbi:MAG: peptidylprolyl isomerase [Planctomycetota bacterium]|nr:peptidylprolyl isomerase [Planctomycetota bacterium]
MTPTRTDREELARSRRRARSGRQAIILAAAAIAGLAAVTAFAAQPAGPQPPAKDAKLQVVARVNGEDISRNELAQECLRHYGEDVLERMTKKYLIIQECRKRQIEVSQDEVNAEIHRMATRFSLPVDQWLTMLKQERGISPVQYANDIIWPTLALKKLAGSQLQITEEEVRKEYEKYYGPAVKARMIACGTLEKAQRIFAVAKANPDQFGNLAKDESEDVNSASAKGLVNPIRRHLGFKEIEDAAFALKEGQISEIIKVAGQYVILKCEGHLPARSIKLEDARPQLEEAIRDTKLGIVANGLFEDLKKNAEVVNVLNDPVKSKQMPGVAALINGSKVSLEELAEMCIERHGEEVLGGTIQRRLLEQECKRRQVTVSEQELDAEIARAAAQMIETKPDGSPNIEKWIELITRQQGVSVEVYRRDAVWPSVALKKLVRGRVEVTEEDLQRGFEANYGERVRCLAIVLDNHRRAQEVWQLARANPTPEHFGELAEQYSVEPGSRALRGEVPPIQRHGGQPLLEKEAFALAPGELSSILQIDQRFLILLCEGRTKPEPVKFEEVKEYLHADIFEKKLNQAMADHFQQLRAQATIDNYIAGTTQAPRKAVEMQPPARTAGRPVDLGPH